MITAKRWGSTEVLIDTPFCEVHRIVVRKNQKCSRHMHKYKNNSFFVESGVLLVGMEDGNKWSSIELVGGDLLNVPPGIEHQFHAFSDVVAFEFYWPDGCKPDIVRRTE